MNDGRSTYGLMCDSALRLAFDLNDDETIAAVERATQIVEIFEHWPDEHDRMAMWSRVAIEAYADRETRKQRDAARLFVVVTLAVILATIALVSLTLWVQA